MTRNNSKICVYFILFLGVWIGVGRGRKGPNCVYKIRSNEKNTFCIYILMKRFISINNEKNMVGLYNRTYMRVHDTT